MWHCSPPPNCIIACLWDFQVQLYGRWENQKWDEMLFSISSYLPVPCLSYCQCCMYRTASFWRLLVLNGGLRFKACGSCSWSQVEFLPSVWKLNSMLFYLVGRTGKNLGGSASFIPSHSRGRGTFWSNLTNARLLTRRLKRLAVLLAASCYS